MAKYTIRVEQPTGVPLPPGAYPEVELRLTEPAVTVGGVLVADGPTVIKVPDSGTVDVELTPSTALQSDRGVPVLYRVVCRWMDEAGTPIPHGVTDWGTFYLNQGGGALSDMRVTPPGTGQIYFVSSREEAERLSLQVGDVVIVMAETVWKVYQEVAG